MLYTKKLLKLFLILSIFSACSQEETELTQIETKEISNIPFRYPTGDPETPTPNTSTGLFWTDGGYQFLVPTTDPKPQKTLRFKTEWYFNKGKIVADVSAYAKTWDYTCADNCYARTQIFLEKDGVVYQNKITPISIDWGDISDPNDSTPEDAETRTDIKWTFDINEDLTGVSIVAQAHLWGCFSTGNCADNGSHSINWNEDQRKLYDLVINSGPPQKPNNFRLTSHMTPTLEWDACEQAEYYKVYRKRGYQYWVEFATVTQPIFKDFSVVGLPKKEEFRYKVYAGNSFGISPWTNLAITQGTTYE